MHMNILQKIENMNCMNGMGSMGILNIVLSYSINFIVFYKYMCKPIDQNTVLPQQDSEGLLAYQQMRYSH